MLLNLFILLEKLIKSFRFCAIILGCNTQTKIGHQEITRLEKANILIISILIVNTYISHKEKFILRFMQLYLFKVNVY